MRLYHRPIVRFDVCRSDQAFTLAGGTAWFAEVEVLSRDAPPSYIQATELDPEILDRLTSPRRVFSESYSDGPAILGILNVTPDSFSDGGRHEVPAIAVARGRQMVADGADMVDVGGESTRPGARSVPVDAEIARVEPVIAALRHLVSVPISIDTRKMRVAAAAHRAGSNMVNDVSGFTYDSALAPYCARTSLPVCVMHAQGDPETMHIDPRYDNVLLDVYDFLDAQIRMLLETGITLDRIVVDPGIGFGKTTAHNLALLHRLSLFHTLGCPILLGASRKKFIGTLSGVTEAGDRLFGSVGVALAAAAHGVQILRVHDVSATRQALDGWKAVQRSAA
jgi:dihydropteroate synthase